MKIVFILRQCVVSLKLQAPAYFSRPATNHLVLMDHLLNMGLILSVFIQFNVLFSFLFGLGI